MEVKLATQLFQSDLNHQSDSWGDLIVGRSQPYHSPTRRSRCDWAAVRSVDAVTVCEDPRQWKSLAVRSMRGDRTAFRQLLEEFSICLEMYFARLLPDNAALAAIDDTLQTVADKLHTCDTRRPILPWLLAIAAYRAENPTTDYCIS